MNPVTSNSSIQATTARAPARVAVEVAPGADTGKSLPVGGKSEPKAVPKIDIPEVNIEEVVQQIQQFISQTERDLSFKVDESSGRTVVSVYSGSGELIRQFPSEEILKIAANLQQQRLNLIDQTA